MPGTIPTTQKSPIGVYITSTGKFARHGHLTRRFAVEEVKDLVVDKLQAYGREYTILTVDSHDNPVRLDVEILVHRFPDQSYARGGFLRKDGTTYGASIPSSNWWDAMPGFLRGGNPKTVEKIDRLAADVADVLRAALADRS